MRLFLRSSLAFFRSAGSLPGAVRWPDAIVRHPVDAARYELIFRLRFHRHKSLPRIVPFSTALATRRVGACRHFVYLYSYRHDFRRTHDLCSHAPGGQFRVHAKRSNQAISLGLNPSFSANPRSFRIHFLQQSKGAFLSHPRFKREVEAFTGRARLCFVRRRRSDF